MIHAQIHYIGVRVCSTWMHVVPIFFMWLQTQRCEHPHKYVCAACIYIAKLLTCFARFQHHMLRLLAKCQHGRKLCWSSRGHGVSLKVPGWEEGQHLICSIVLSKKFPFTGYLCLHKSRFLFGIRLLQLKYFVICQCCVPVGASGIFQQANRNQRMNKQHDSRTILE